jgi:hypothetical protein
MGIGQQAIDKSVRTFYAALAIAGCLSSLAFVALGLYGAASGSTLKSQFFFAGLAAMGTGLGIRSVYFLKHIWTHNDLPSEEV